MLGLEEVEAGDWAAAISSFERVVAMVPDLAAAHFNLGMALFEFGALQESIEAYKRALQIHEDWDTLDSYGKSLAAHGSNVYAREAFQRAADLPEINQQQRSISLRNQAFTFVHSGDWSAANDLFRRAIGCHSSERNLECLFSSLNAIEQAPVVLEEIQKLRESMPNAKLGTRLVIQESRSLHAIGRHRAALEKLIEDTENPTDVNSLFAQIANSHLLLGHTSEALGCIHKLVSTNPNSWSWMSEWVRVLNRATGVTPERIFQNTNLWYEQFDKARKPRELQKSPQVKEDSSTRKRIAILLNADCDEVLCGQILPWLRSRSRELLHVTIVWDHWGASRFQDALKSMADEWQTVALWHDQTLANWCAKQDLDLFVDCIGHGARNRLVVTRMHPAKRHVLWNYQQQTSGLPEMDFVVHDSYVASRLDESCVSESILSPSGLGVCASWLVGQVDIRTSIHRTDSQIIRYGFAGDLAFVSPMTLDLWAGVLAASPDSLMVIRTPEFLCKSILDETIDALAHRDCSSDRIVAEYLEKKPTGHSWIDDIDVFLDSAPANHVAGVSIAIFQGIPVVSLAGKRPLELATASMLQHGVEGIHLVDSFEQYVAKACSLGALPTWQDGPPSNLSKQKKSLQCCDLFDEQRYAAAIDQLFFTALGRSGFVNDSLSF